jgi:FixJ family two-component response regulator
MALANSQLIAVVDDEAAVRKALIRLFRSSGYEAKSFASGAEFLGSLAGETYGCLILDLHMPGMNGAQVQSDARLLMAGLPVIVITAHDEPACRQQCLDAGACGYLRKPFEERELLHLVAHLMDIRGGTEART